MNATTAAGVPAMAQQARELARAGRINDASNLWQRVLAVDPNHTEALLAMATQALARRDSAGALQILQHAAATHVRGPCPKWRECRSRRGRLIVRYESFILKMSLPSRMNKSWR